jgi:hypothetical protein
MKPQEALTRVIEHREILHDEMLSLMRQIMGEHRLGFCSLVKIKCLLIVLF